ncbi:hypothetical protein GCM10022409_17600 [Hymenobacter glaciei]|uniref:Outer membrane protein beta-barrel domain-containing protein n=1 Tax=Hymenobacter glaciei TaxID=877209 RepID=A0ABP7U081_9BACT
MHKIFLLFGALAGLAGSAQGQTIRYGLKAGVSLARLTNYDVTGVRNQVGATAGLMADAALSEKLSLHPELLFSQKGMRVEGSGPGGYTSSLQSRSNYLDLPVLLRLKFGSFFAEAGPQVGYLLTLKSTSTVSSSTMPSLTYTSRNTNGLRRLDLGYVVGVGYQLLERWELGARYNGGILSLFSESNDSGLPRNSVFQFQAGYLFGSK